MDRLKYCGQCVSSFFDRLLYSGIYLWTGIYTRHRNHPWVRRFIFILAVLYAITLTVALFYPFDDVKVALYWISPGLRNADPEFEGHADDCSLSYELLVKCFDIFVFAHFVGYSMRGVIYRDYGMCWLSSITWEVTEIAFLHIMPNFIECWWDTILLDLLFGNAIGIWFGMYMCSRLKLERFNWESVYVKGTDDRGKEPVRKTLSFKPKSYLGPDSAYRRILPVSILLIISQVEELNYFFLKRILKMPSSHFLFVIRTYIVSASASPAVKETYECIAKGKRVGASVLVFVSVILAETLVCFKFGMDLMRQLSLTHVMWWVIAQVILSAFFVIFSISQANRKDRKYAKVTEAKKNGAHMSHTGKTQSLNGPLVNGYTQRFQEHANNGNLKSRTNSML